MLKDSGLSLRCQGNLLFVGDDNLLLRRIDDEYGQQPSRLRRARVGAHLVVIAGHLRPAFSCLIDMLGLVVDLATNLTGCIDEGRGGVAM